jgi:hypothetical protein
MGEMMLRHLIVNLLSQRLQIEDWYRRHPEIDDEPIVAPLIGLGLPRTGSTALSILLAEDPNVRTLRKWEAAQPCPPPSTVDGPDPRIAVAEAQHAQRSARLEALVPSTPTGPEECQDLMALDFKAHYFQAFAAIPSYSSWFLDADLTPTYLYERRVLKLLQWGERPRPWRLKCPTHLLFLDHLDVAFPDARFVMTHRDTAEVIVSVADLYGEVSSQFCDEIDHHYYGALNVEHWSAAMDRVAAFRDAGNDHRFFDIGFRAMQQQPIEQVRRLYDWLGEPVTDEFEAGMRDWWESNAEHRAPNIHPDPATFGLDLDEVRATFAEATARAATWIATQEHHA